MTIAENNFSSRPIIAYVDEAADERDNFFGDAYDSGLFETIHILPPDQNIQNLIENLLNLGIDALITDFNLSEAAPLSYNGEDLVSSFLTIRHDFPCFIRTSYGPAALDASQDVNRVYSKDESEEKNLGRDFFQRVVLQTEHYRKRFENWKVELALLLEKDKAALTASDIDHILDLDAKIEASLGKDMAISDRVKRSLLEKETELLHETELLIAEIKRTLGN